MRLIFLVVLLCVLVGRVEAQSRISFGPEAGYILSDMLLTDHEYSSLNWNNNFIRNGFFFGVSSLMEISQSVDLNGSLLFESKGNKYRDENEDLEYKRKFNHLKLPINVVFDFNGDDNGVKLLAGIYAGVAVGGNLKLKGETTKTVKLADLDVKKVDYGFINLGLGYSYDRMQVNLLYNTGGFNVYGEGSRFINFRLGAAYYLFDVE